MIKSMRKNLLLTGTVCMLLLLMVTLSSCGNVFDNNESASEDEKTVTLNRGDSPEKIVIDCCADYEEGTWVTSYSNTHLKTDEGAFAITNENSFDVDVSIGYSIGDTIDGVTIKPGETETIKDLEKDVEYTIGCGAKVDEGTAMSLTVKGGLK